MEDSINEDTVTSENLTYEGRNITEWKSNGKHIIALFAWAMGFVNIFDTSQLLLKGSFLDFLITHIPMMIIIGIPLTFMELSISQYSNRSTKSWNLCPTFRGIGYSKLIIIFLFQIYYNVLNSYVLLYTFSSFSKSVRWSNCNASWANSSCYSIEEYKLMEHRRDYQSSVEQFWFNGVLKLNENSNKLEWPHWELMVYLCPIMFIVFLATYKGTKSLEKVLPITMIISSLEIIILFFITALTSGSLPGFQQLNNLNIYVTTLLPWKKNSMIIAAFQNILLSLGLGLGGFSSLGAQSTFRQPVHAYAIFLNLINSGSAIFYNILIRNLYGVLSHYTKVEVEEIITPKNMFSNNIFTALPSAFLYLPGTSQIWIFLFYSSTFLKGLTSSMLMASVILQVIYEFGPNLMKKSVLCSIVCSTIICLSGIILYTNLGIIISTYLYELIYTTLLPLINCCQIIAIIYFYGLANFMDDLHFMLGFRPSAYWQLSLVASSFLLPTLTTFSIIQFFSEFRYAKYDFIIILQKCLISITLIWIPFMALVRMIRKGNWGNVFLPSKDWGPHDNVLKHSRKMFTDQNLTSEYVYEKNLLKNKLYKYEDNYYNLQYN